MAEKPVKLSEIADRINAHLKRFEADPAINVMRKGFRGSPFYSAQSFRAGNRVGVQYVSYHGHSTLTRDDALKYLAWLDAGNIGAHFNMPKVAQ